LFIIPERAEHFPGVSEKQEALEIAKIVGSESLALHYSNLHYNMAYYITAERMKILPIKDDDDQFNSQEFYLIPEDVISDSVESTSYYTFVRSFEQKTFHLIKYDELPTSLKNHE
jgi:hypothetical protein